MKRYSVDLSEEKHILANMITDSEYLYGIKDICKSTLFETSYARIIASWIWEYQERTSSAPKKDIQDIYAHKRSEISEEEDLELVADFLKGISDYYEKAPINNLQYEIQKAETYFKLRSLEQLNSQIQNSIIAKDPRAGEKLIAEYKRVEKPTGSGIDLFKDASAIEQAFEFHEEHMFSYPGVLGEVVGSFNRGDFLAILARVKMGKTYYLWDIARYATLFGYNALFFSLEMSRNQMIRRGWQAFIGNPIKAGAYEIPQFEETGEENEWRVIKKKKAYKDILSVDIPKRQKLYQRQLKGTIRLEVFPSGVADVKTLESCMTNLEYYDGFVPDVICVDYADIISSNNREYRHRLNDIWVRLRGWAQEKNCLVATASQINKGAYSRDAQMGDVSEDSRKLATVTKMFALNQVPEERELGIMRVEPLLSREGKVFSKQVCVLESRDIGRVYLDSKLQENVINYHDGSINLKGEK